MEETFIIRSPLHYVHRTKRSAYFLEIPVDCQEIGKRSTYFLEIIERQNVHPYLAYLQFSLVNKYSMMQI